MIRNKSISLVIPCKNEEKSLPLLLAKLPKWIDEVIVVDNNSTDKTVEVAKGLGAKVVVEKRKDKFGIGYGYAHQKGMKKAKGDYIATMDGDGTYPLKAIRLVVAKMESKGIDFVTCSRFPLKNREAISKLRQLGVWILNTQVKVLYGYPMQDILSGMWVMKRATASKLKLKEGGWDLSPEIKLEAIMNKAVAFEQYHIDHDPRDNGASKQALWTTGFNHLKYIVRRRLGVDNPIKVWLLELKQKQGVSWRWVQATVSR